MTHIHSVIVSYERPELTEQAILSYLDTVSISHELIVVDNGSSHETVERLSQIDADFQLQLLGENRYPGYATNRGWEMMSSETTLLHRGDNDFSYLPGWCEEVLLRFEKKDVGQVGLRTKKEELGANWNVGGNNVIRRKLWDEGLRYDERPWGDYPIGWTEDSLFSPEVKRMGYRWVRVKKNCIVSLASGDWSDPYYERSYSIRGIEKKEEEEA